MGAASNCCGGFSGYRGRGDRACQLHARGLAGGAGYVRLAVGKWHLAPIEETSAADTYVQWPLARGFDRSCGFLDGATDHWVPDLVAGNYRIDPPGGVVRSPRGHSPQRRAAGHQGHKLGVTTPAAR